MNATLQSRHWRTLIGAAVIAVICAVAAVALSSTLALADGPVTTVKNVSIEKGKTVNLVEYCDTGSQYFQITTSKGGVVTLDTKAGSDSDYYYLTAKGLKAGSTQVIFSEGVMGYGTDEDGNETEEFTPYSVHVFNITVWERVTKTVKPGRALTIHTAELDDESGWHRASSSNNAVVKPVTLMGWNDETFTKLVCLKPGKATITETWGETEGYMDEEGNWEEREVLKGKRVWSITVSNSGKYAISKAECDNLWTGKYYSIKGLFSDYAQFGAYPALRSKTGKFLSGSGYRVYKNGTLVKFTKGGAKTVKFRSGGKTYYLTLDAVHSQSATQAVVSKTMKARYASYKHVKTSLLSRPAGYVLRDTYTIKKSGKRVTKYAYATFQDGVLRIEY
ncbi:MAG: hypothetical protein Q4D06_09220 [Coriobacteriia bacterium]|nr:hypothetical protein [Coriobacteriia bacterium]